MKCKTFKWEKISDWIDWQSMEYILVDISILFLCSYIWCRGWRSWTCPCPRCWRPRRSRGRCWRWTASGARGCGCPWSRPPARSAAAPRPEWGTCTKKLFLFRKNISSLAEKYLVHRISFPVITPTVLPRILSQLYALDHEIVLLDNCGIMQRISQKEILAYSFEIFKTVTLVIKDQILKHYYLRWNHLHRS